MLYRSATKCHALGVPTAIPTSLSERHKSAASTPANTMPLQYRLDVLAVRAVDVVESAGGWLFDRVLAGWHVHVLLADRTDSASLRILGASVGDLSNYLSNAETSNKDHARSVAVSADLCARDSAVYAAVARLVASRHVEVALWGTTGATLQLEPALECAHHQLTTAARVFKARALAAAGAHTAADSVEDFLCASLRHIDDHRDLVAGASRVTAPVTASRPRPVSADLLDTDPGEVAGG